MRSMDERSDGTYDAGVPGGRDDGVPGGSTTVEERALLVPLESTTVANTRGAGTVVMENRLSANSRSTTHMRMSLCSDGPDAVIDGRSQVISAKVPNWLRVVFNYAGSNHGPNAELPAEIELSVQVDTATRRIVAVDIARAETEYAAYRSVATHWWKEEEGLFSGVRGLFGAPKAARRGARGLGGAWRSEATKLRAEAADPDGPPVAHGEAETEQLRRTANTIAHRLAADPAKLTPIRASALAAGPMMVENVRSGSMAMADLESWLTFQQGSGAITRDEAAAWRAGASGASEA